MGRSASPPAGSFVHGDVAKDFTEAVVEKTRGLKLGNGLDEGVEVGPMFEDRAMQHALELVEDAKRCGAKVLTGGARSTRFERGYFFEPTVVDQVPESARILHDEPFAPVMPVVGFDRLDDVIKAANNTPYGLAAYVFTNDVSTVWRMAEGLEAGIIGVNDPVPTAVQCPFGGVKESGQGRELGVKISRLLGNEVRVGPDSVNDLSRAEAGGDRLQRVFGLHGELVYVFPIQPTRRHFRNYPR